MKKALKDIARIDTGYHFRGKVEPDPAGTIRVVQIKDIDSDHRIHVEGLTLVGLDGLPEKYVIGEGDVLFLARGREPFALAVCEPLPNTIATGYFFVLRTDAEEIDPRYLAWYLNQPPFRSALRNLMQGTHTPVITRADIQDLPVEVPPLATQRTIAALDDLQRRERQLLRALEEKRAQLIQAIGLQAVQSSP